jgi:4,5-DOPA dioxygenase extradiol
MKRMPVLFVGHGSPMNAIEDNAWSRGFAELAALVPPPQAILAVSAHWFVPGTFTTGNESPGTIHDFGGFPEPLYEIAYPAPGSPALALRAAELLGARASVSLDWGLDHGTWSVLHHLRPAADVPVVQLSVDRRLPPEEHLALGRALAPLREEGVLVMGSGNITHNLGDAFASVRRGETATPEWAERFDREIAAALVAHDDGFLVSGPETQAGRLSHPTLDHYLPLLYAAGAADEREGAGFPITGFDLASLSMRSVLFS